MSSMFNGTIADLLSGDVEVKSNKIRNKIDRIAKRSPEVMIKMSGTTKNASHMDAHLSYISRHGDVELEDEEGNIIKGKDNVRELSKYWKFTTELGNPKKNTRWTTNLVLSMPAGTDKRKVKAAASAFAKKQFSKNWQYVMALHEDTKKPHVHLTIKNLGYDMRKLHVKKGEPQRWRELFAKELRERGVPAEATSRTVRGVIKKSTNQSVVHLRSRKASETDKAKLAEILNEIRTEQGAIEPKPWEIKIKSRQNEIRRSWLDMAKNLKSSNQSEDVHLSNNIVKFVNDMPPLKTERHEMKEILSKQISAVMNKENENEK